MLVSFAWLEELVDLDGLGARDAADALTARGLTVDSVSGAAGSEVLDLDVPANRPDCLGHLGVARELSAAFSRPLLPRPTPSPATGPAAADAADVAIEAEDLCPRYTARLVRGVRVGPSPARVVARLEACGLRSVNNVVDASNLVLLETGHPIHAFDFARIEGGKIRVRRAGPGETIETLDGVLRTLGPEVLVIADRTRPVAVAGVLGGAATEIRGSTRDVLVEAAVFDPGSVRSTARRLGLATDASHRFERGVDPDGVLAAQDLAVRLLGELASGAAAPGLVDVHPRPAAPRVLHLRPERVRRLLGYDPGLDATRDALARLGIRIQDAPGGALLATPPTWRVDLLREADLVEEVGRHLGYDRIPVAAASARLSPLPDRLVEAEERARTALAGLGFHEAFNYAMNAAGEDDAFVEASAPGQIVLTNPIAEPLARLRRSVLPGLLRAADRNLRHGAEDVRLFEVGRVFLRREADTFPDERPRAGIAWAGAGEPRHFSARPRPVDFFDLAGAVETVLEALQPGIPWARRRSHLSGLHPRRSAVWSSAAAGDAAWGGELHPDLAASLGLETPLLVAEIDLATLLSAEAEERAHAPLPRLPAVTRDLSFVLSAGQEYAALTAALRGVAAPAPVRFEAVDRYEGSPLAEGESSLTVRVILQPSEATLTDPEVERYRSALIAAAEREAGARIRGGTEPPMGA